MWPPHSWQGDPTSHTSELPYFHTPTTFLLGDSLSIAATMSTEMDHVSPYQALKYSLLFPNLPWYPLVFIPPSVVLLPSIPAPPMNTRKKNKSAHPGIPDMTPYQLASAQLASADFPRPGTARRTSKKLTKDQQIAALKDELRATKELVLNVRYFFTCPSDSYHTHLYLPSRARWTATMHRRRSAQVAIPSPQLTTRKTRSPTWAQNARPQERLIQHQGKLQTLCTLLHTY